MNDSGYHRIRYLFIDTCQVVTHSLLDVGVVNDWSKRLVVVPVLFRRNPGH